MGTFDIKSVLIGVLSTIVAVLLVSHQTPTQTDKNLGEATVTSLTVVNDQGQKVAKVSGNNKSGVVKIFNAKEQLLARMGASGGPGGAFHAYNTQGEWVGAVAVNVDGDGIVQVNNDRGAALVRLGIHDDYYGMVTSYTKTGDQLWTSPTR